jgi:ATP-dependent helicase/DNAse subunit B
MKGYIDRVDDTPAGLLAIDYKTSSAPPKGVKNEAGRTKIDIQLPLYMKVALPILYPGRPIAGGIYYSLTKGKPLGSVSSEYTTELDAFAEKVKQILLTGNYAVEPDADRHACIYCDYDIVCRKGQRLYRKGKSE